MRTELFIVGLVLTIIVIGIVLFGKLGGARRITLPKLKLNWWSLLFVFLLLGTPCGLPVVRHLAAMPFAAWGADELAASIRGPSLFTSEPPPGELSLEEELGLAAAPTESWQELPLSWVEQAPPSELGEPRLLFGGTMPPRAWTQLTFAPSVSEHGAARWYWSTFKRDASLPAERELGNVIDQGAVAGRFDGFGYSQEEFNRFNEVRLVGLVNYRAAGPQHVEVIRSSHRGVVEYELTLRRPDQFHLTVPEGIRYMWIVAPPCWSWQAKYCGHAVPPEGLVLPDPRNVGQDLLLGFEATEHLIRFGYNREEARQKVHSEELPRYQMARHNRPMLDWMATYCQVGGRVEPVVYYRMFTAQDAGTPVTLGLNAPGGTSREHAARIIVGIME